MTSMKGADMCSSSYRQAIKSETYGSGLDGLFGFA